MAGLQHETGAGAGHCERRRGTQMTAPFVLLHGGSLGGWCFQRVARELRRAGHEVYTPTLTGFGERNHLKGADITMETHIRDVANVLEFEDLRDVVLVGHSLVSGAKRASWDELRWECHRPSRLVRRPRGNDSGPLRP